jgi:hypothetical protein
MSELMGWKDSKISDLCVNIRVRNFFYYLKKVRDTTEIL